MQTVSSQPNNQRISELAVLPVFFDLRGKRVAVIGGSAPAAWKIELLAAAGAQVDVYAEEVCEELDALVKSPSPVSTYGRSTLSPRGRGTRADAVPFFSPSGKRWRVAPDEGDAIDCHPC